MARLIIPLRLELFVVTIQGTISRECSCQRPVRKVLQRRASRTAAIRHRQTFIGGPHRLGNLMFESSCTMERLVCLIRSGGALVLGRTGGDMASVLAYSQRRCKG